MTGSQQEGQAAKAPLLRQSGSQDPRLQALPVALQRKAEQREPFSLCLALKRFAFLMLPGALIAVGLVYREGLRTGGVSVAIVVVAAVVLIGSTLEQRIDVDEDGLTFVPLLPIRPRQRFPYAAFKPFEDGVSTVVYGPARGKPRQRATITDPAYAYKVAGLFPRKVIETTNFYGVSYSETALGAREFIASLDAYHPGSADYVGRRLD
jgi:hypothetical protein